MRGGSNAFAGCGVNTIAAVVIVSAPLMRHGGMVVAVRQGADVPYQRECQQDQQAERHQRGATP
jgi:hypothetical protein